MSESKRKPSSPDNNPQTLEVRPANAKELKQITSWLTKVFSTTGRSNYGFGDSFSSETIPLENIQFIKIVNNNPDAPTIFIASRYWHTDHSLQVETNDPAKTSSLTISNYYENYGPYGYDETLINLVKTDTVKYTKTGHFPESKPFHFFDEAGNQLEKTDKPAKIIVAGIGCFFGGDLKKQFNFTIAQA